MINKKTAQKIFFVVSIFFGLIIQTSLAADNKAEKPILIETGKAVLSQLNKQITVTGTLRANQGTTIKSEIPGRISEVYFKSGDNVIEGAPIIQLNKDVLTSQLQQSQADLVLDSANYERSAQLIKTKTITKAAYDEAASKLAVSKAKLAKDQAMLNQAFLKAPFAGRLGLSLVNKGDYIEPGKAIVSLQAINPIEVEFTVPEVYLSKIMVGQEVKVTSDAYPNQVFAGKVYAIDATINENNRTFAVRATLPNSESKLLPGGFVEVNIDMQNKAPLLIVPQVAVVYDLGQAYVFKVVGDKVVKTKVALGERDKENVEILSGLTANDIVVTAGQPNIQDGSIIKTDNQAK